MMRRKYAADALFFSRELTFLFNNGNSVLTCSASKLTVTCVRVFLFSRTCAIAIGQENSGNSQRQAEVDRPPRISFQVTVSTTEVVGCI